MRPLVIVNPSAGGGRAGKMFAEIRPIVERALGSIDVALTERGGHAIELARAAAEAGRELVVALGGDGTLNEVVNGVLDARTERNDATAVGFIGQGTGGDFRRSLDLEHRLDRYLDAIASGRERRVDVGRATFRTTLAGEAAEGRRWFVNVLSAGLGGLVDRYVAEQRGALAPTLAYAWASARALAESEPAPLTCIVRLAGERTERRIDAYAVAICNGGSFGSGMRIAPMARLDDGRFEVVALNAPSKLGFARIGRKLYAGAHLGEEGVLHFACDAIEIARAPDPRPSGAHPRPFLLDVDGEPLGELPLRIELAPKALRVRA